MLISLLCKRSLDGDSLKLVRRNDEVMKNLGSFQVCHSYDVTRGPVHKIVLREVLSTQPTPSPIQDPSGAVQLV